MSVVTGVVLCAGYGEDESLFEKIDEWLVANDFLPLAKVEEYLPRGKHPEMYVRGGGYNYFPNTAFVAFVMQLPWEEPDGVVLVLNPEEGPAQVHRPRQMKE